MVIHLPVEEQCRGVLSEPLPNLQLLTGNGARLGFFGTLLLSPLQTAIDLFLFFYWQLCYFFHIQDLN